MPQREDPAYNEALRKRLLLIIKLSGLEIPGFAEFVSVSLSHLYAILNGNRKLTNETARRIAKRFGLKVENIFRLDYEIPASIRAAPELREFSVREKDIPEYFQETKDQRKPSYFIEHELVNSTLFKEDEPTYLWEAREFCRSKERYYTSDKLSKLLKYQVKRGKLRSKKRRIKRRNGSLGTRMVDVFFKVKENASQ